MKCWNHITTLLGCQIHLVSFGRRLSFARWFELRKMVCPIVERWEKAISAQEYRDARTCISKLESYLHIDSNLACQEAMEVLKKETADAYWDHCLQKIDAANSAADNKKVASLCGKLIDEYEAGGLANATEMVVLVLRVTRLSVLRNMAVWKKKWQEGISLCNKVAELVSTSTDRDMFKDDTELAIDYKEFFEFQLLQAEYEEARKALVFDRERRLAILGRLEQMKPAQERTPHIRRNLSPTIDAKVIDGFRQLMVLEETMHQIGGRAMVEGFYQGLNAGFAMVQPQE
jgi:hypothetical protein